MASEEELLDYESANESAQSTILLIHGAGTSALSWDLVQPFLSSYHLLMPSIFTARSISLARAHKESSKVADWHPAYLELFAKLVHAKAKDGRVHIVGHSMGASLALGFAAKYPDLISSLFVSGLPEVRDRPPAWKRSIAHGLLFGVQKIEDSLSRDFMDRLLDDEVKFHRGGWDGKGQMATSELLAIAMDNVSGCTPSPLRVSTSESDTSTTTREPVRAFVVAATRKKWWMPVGDSVTWAVDVAKGLCDFRAEEPGVAVEHEVVSPTIDARALEAKNMFHPWVRQNPEMFAECIVACIEGGDLPQEGITEVWHSPASQR